MAQIEGLSYIHYEAYLQKVKFPLEAPTDNINDQI